MGRITISIRPTIPAPPEVPSTLKTPADRNKGIQDTVTYLKRLRQFLSVYLNQLGSFLQPPNFYAATIDVSLSPYNVSPTDCFLIVTGATTVNLPQAAASGRIVVIVRGGVNTVTVHPFAGDLISGSGSNDTIATQWLVNRYFDYIVGEWIRW